MRDFIAQVPQQSSLHLVIYISPKLLWDQDAIHILGNDIKLQRIVEDADVHLNCILA